MFARVSVALPAFIALAIAGAAAEIPLRPIPLDWSEAERSVIDLSRWLDAPAGEDGPLRVAGGHLLRPDGRRFRAWGVNAPFDVCFVSKELAPRVAQDFARLGFNCVRFHHLDVPWGANIFDLKFDDTQHLNPETLDTLAARRPLEIHRGAGPGLSARRGNRRDRQRYGRVGVAACGRQAGTGDRGHAARPRADWFYPATVG